MTAAAAGWRLNASAPAKLEGPGPRSADLPTVSVTVGDNADNASGPVEVRRDQRHISVVVPCFNEAEVLSSFHDRLAPVMEALPYSWTVIYVNDGSRDSTLDVMLGLRARGPNVSILSLSRNFGKEVAMTAGLDHATGDAVVIIDADLQDPPEVIPELVAAWQLGADVAYAQRRARAGETWAKRTTASLFYRLMTHVGRITLPVNTGDFRLMNRRVVDSLLRLREHHRFMKGLYAWVGYSQVAVRYDRAPRHAGRSKWNYWHLWNLAIEGVTGFTVLPLKFATYLGLLIAVLASIYGIFIVGKTVFMGSSVPGYASLMVVILALGGTQLMTLGVLGEYLGRVFNEVKARPLYIVERYAPARLLAPAEREGPREEEVLLRDRPASAPTM